MLIYGYNIFYMINKYIFMVCIKDNFSIIWSMIYDSYGVPSMLPCISKKS